MGEEKKSSTVNRRANTISVRHQDAGFPSPCSTPIVLNVKAGIAARQKYEPARKDALTFEELRAIVRAVEGEDAVAWRDRSILLLGYEAALARRVAALNVEDLDFIEDAGMSVRIAGHSDSLFIQHLPDPAMCAACAVRRYLTLAGISNGPVFRVAPGHHRTLTGRRIDGELVASLVKEYAAKAGLEGDFSGHSLRAGFATTAAINGATITAIARTTRHRHGPSVARYVPPSIGAHDNGIAKLA